MVGVLFALPLTDHQGLENAQEPVAVRREILQDVDRSAAVTQDGDHIGGRHLGSDELLCGCKSSELISRLHGSHVEVHREESPILVPRLLGFLASYAGAIQLLKDRDVFVGRGRWSKRRANGREDLMLEVPNLLRDTILGKGKIIGRETLNRFA